MKKVIFCALVASFAMLSVAKGQDLKFAHINSQQLIEMMPESDSAQKMMQAFEKDLTDQMEQLQVEFNKKYQDYVQKRESLSPALRETREKELQDLGQRFQEYQAAAQKDIRDLQAKLMQPILEKAHNAIKKVGEEKGFVYVFDTSTGVLLYQSAKSTDILPLVKKELGINK